MTEVLVTDRFALRAQLSLENDKRLQVKKAKTPSCHEDDLATTEVLVIRSKTVVDKSLLDRAPKLKLVVTATSGFDHIDLVETARRNIATAFTPEANAASAAELTWGLVLACARSITRADSSLKSGQWQSKVSDGMQLSGHTYGVIGLGRIGQRVARMARAFGMEVIAFDPYCEDSNFENSQAKRVSLEEALKLSDVISLHVPATAETKRLINASTLEYLHRGAILVNTSRGQAMDEQDVYMALQKGWIKSLGLDVFAREPLAKDSNLLKCENVVFTPHIGARTEEAFEQASLDAAKQVLSYLDKGDLAHPLPPKEAWYTSPKGFN